MLRDMLDILSVDCVKVQFIFRHMKFNPQNFKLMKFRKIVMSQNLKTTKFLVMILDNYMVSSTKPY